MLELREIITAGRRPGQRTLEEIQEHLTGRHETENGAYLCSYAVFESIYRVMERVAEHAGPSMILMLCTLEEADGIPCGENASQEMLVQRLEQAICASLRNTDIVCRCGKFQYLALMVDAEQERCDSVQTQINESFDTRRPKSAIRYEICRIS